jgi:hypothetical protein
LWTLVALYVLAVPFQTLLALPGLQQKLQMPELLFPALLLAFAVWAWRRDGPLLRPSFTDMAGVALLAGTAISSLGAGLARGALLELAGTFYLVLLYLVLRTVAATAPDRLAALVVLSAAVAAVLGVLGFALAHAGIPTRLAWPAKEYMYFGPIGRGQAFTTNPNMLASILTGGILLCLGYAVSRRQRPVLWMALTAILCAGFLATLSKGGLTLLIGLAVWAALLCPRRMVGLVAAGLAATCLLAFLWVSHFYVHRGGDSQLQALVDDAFLGDTPIANVAGRDVFATSYLINKRTSLAAFLRHPLLGIGPGGHGQFVRGLRRQGRYPSQFPDYDPHSTYLGALAEQGAVGGFALAVAVAVVATTAASTWRRLRTSQCRGIVAALVAAFAAYSVDAVSTDILNFRHLWLLLALLAVWHGRRNRAPPPGGGFQSAPCRDPEALAGFRTTDPYLGR